ncbi:type-F conjugative transfer system secretin TraK [Escherichia coli]|uniref:type-F conjugative transfer system secretin TraK n=1 Tax=Escherichia coli TaxID=562 RepID=UPI00193B3D5F|nr:type-F conjugative transfer system secretin TraK [Escherichia coli]MBM2913565.1 type-F conjugative transfer system secretin TraK [Escherichia coli]HBB1544182.1 type-F conjugative transfer system secretin TraK [Escherichia coli]
MRKKNQRNKWQTLPGMVALLCGLAGNVQAAPVAQKPVQVPVSPDAQARIALSNTQPNLLVVPGDRIVGVDSAQGTFTNTGEYGQTGIANGGVILMTEKTAPFTFYIRTEGGLVVSVIGQPQARDGRVVHLISERPVRHQAAAAWERSHDYVALLVDVQRTLMKGDTPPGYVFSPIVAAPVFSLPAGLVARADGMWSGDLLRVYRYRISNRQQHAAVLSESQFSEPGVRSVVIYPRAETLLPGATTDVWVMVGQTEARDG